MRELFKQNGVRFNQSQVVGKGDVSQIKVMDPKDSGKIVVPWENARAPPSEL